MNSIKRVSKYCLKVLLQSKIITAILYKIIIPINAMVEERYMINKVAELFRINSRVREIFKDHIVLNGTFKGLKYPNYESFGSEIFPKLLGSYESELAPVFKKILKKDYSSIIDIGCAEGYYAVGLAIKYHNASIYAYDTDEHALQLCREMAVYNNVNNVEYRSNCTEDTLTGFIFPSRGLIISDCEGCESTLFTEKSVQNLKKCDILIETHDLYDNTISSKLEKLFEKTHKITKILSTDDLQKVKYYNYIEIKELSTIEKESFLKKDGVVLWNGTFMKQYNKYSLSSV